MSPPSRTPTQSETIVSVAVVIVLAVIAAGVYRSQYRFNPAVMMQYPGAQLSDTGSVVSATPPESIIDGLRGISPLSAPEQFGPQTLSDKINGKAELYLSAGFENLVSQRFKLGGGSDAWIEMFIFEMTTPENAFAVYTMQQREDAEPLPIGPHVYRTGNALFGAHGRFYVEVIGSEASQSVLTVMQQTIEAFMARHAPDQNFEQSDPKKLFPQTGFIQDSLTLIPADAFGFDLMDQVYIAEYRIKDRDLTAFVSKRPSTADAQKLVQAYHGFLIGFGATPHQQPQAEPDIQVVSLMGAYEIVFSSGVFAAGVHDAADLQQALELALDMKKHLEEQ